MRFGESILYRPRANRGAREMTLLQGYPLGCTLELETELCHDGTWNHEGELDPSTPT